MLAAGLLWLGVRAWLGTARVAFMAETPRAEIGVIGGSGFYSFLDDIEEVTIDTPYGPPSDPIAIGELSGRRVAFVPRHGRDHRYPPHRIPYRANLWALRSLGVGQVLGPERGRLTDPRLRTRHPRRPRPARRPHLGPVPDFL